jgi:hypothetical protein
MTNEEFEKKRDFILEQQAQFSVDIQRLREAQTQTEQVIAQTGEIVTRLANVTLVGFKEVNAKSNALVDSQIRTDEKFQALADSQMRTDEKIGTLVDSQLRSDKRINALEDSQIRTDDNRETDAQN